MRSDSAGAPPGLSIDNTTALTLGFANAFSRMGMTCFADATLCDEISPSIRTTPTTLPNGPPLESHGGGEEDDVRDAAQQRDSDQSQLKKGLPPSLAFAFADKFVMLLAHVGSLGT